LSVKDKIRTSLCVILVGLCCISHIRAQENRTTVTGDVIEDETGQPVEFANVVLSKNGDHAIATTDSTGIFHFQEVPYGIYRLTISYVGFRTVSIQELAVEHQQLPPIQIRLEPSSLKLDEVVVQAVQPLRVSARLSGGYTLTPEEVRRFPATFYDPARLATVYPGVVNINDQANNLAIRGNSPNQMNFYIHGAEIVNSNHLANAGTSTDRTTMSGGSVNMFSAQLLENTEIYTGVLPTNLLQATSGAMNYHLKRGSRTGFHFTGQVGLNGIDVAAEGPIGNRWSYIANYRYSTVGLLSQLGVDFSDETILYQDLSIQVSFYQNEKVKWSFFAMGGDNSNSFEAKVDSAREEFKDAFDIDFKSQIGIAGANVEVHLSDQLRWHTTLAASTRWDQRSQTSSTQFPDAEDYLELTKYAFHTQLSQQTTGAWGFLYGLNTTLWQGGMEYQDFGLSEKRFGENVRGVLLRPYAETHWRHRMWRIDGGLAVSYNGLNNQAYFQPRLSLMRHLPHRQKLAVSSGLHHKLQPYQILFSSDSHAELPMLQSWKTTLTYEKDFQMSQIRATVYYENISDVGAGDNGFSALNILEEYPPISIGSDGKGQNKGIELAYQRFLNQGLFLLISGTLFDARYRNPDMEAWTNSHFNNQCMFNTTIGKEFEFSTGEKQKVLGMNFQLVYSGGFWETPIDLTASRAAGRTIRNSTDLFSQQLPAVLKTYFRIYYKINHSKRYSLIGLDLSNVINRQNVSYSYYDPLLDEIVMKHQLGLIPMLSYVIRI